MLLGADKPQFTKEPKTVLADGGSGVELECEADGNPAPTYTWTRNGDSSTVVANTTKLKLTVSADTVSAVQLTISPIRPRQVGVYVCRVTVLGYPELRAEAQVLQHGPPAFLPASTAATATAPGEARTSLSP